MASNRSTPNIPRLERVKVPTESENEHNGKASKNSKYQLSLFE